MSRPGSNNEHSTGKVEAENKTYSGVQSPNWLTSKKGECGQGQNRTADTRIFSPLLYRLSYLARSLEYSLKVAGSQDWRLRFTVLFCSLLDEVDHLALKMDAGQRVDFLNTRGAGDVDLGQIVADHVQTNKV